MDDGVTSFRPGPDETLVKRSSGRTLVNGRSEVVRESNINEATGSLQPSPSWLPNEVANFQSMSDQPSDVPSYILSPEAEPFVPKRTEHDTPKQQTAKKLRSPRRRSSAGNTETLPNNVSDEVSGMAKTPTAGMSCETETKSLANSNGLSKAKTPKKTVLTAQHRQKTILCMTDGLGLRKTKTKKKDEASFQIW